MKRFLLVLGVLLCMGSFMIKGLVYSEEPDANNPKLYIHDNRVTPAEKVQIDKILPDKAFVKPKKERKLLIFDVNSNYGGHSAITYANYALEKMGKKTSAFTIERINDPSVFEWDSLKKYDAIFINNVVGAPFNDEKLFQNIVRFVKEGGGLMGVHGTTAAFITWGKGGGEDIFPEFGQMIGGRGANHRTQNEKIHLRIDEPNHPLTQMFPANGIDWEDEYFRFPTIYSRDKLRVLLSIDVKKSNLVHGKPFRQERTDDDYGVAWIQSYGKGRVFYCSLAHNPKVFFEPTMLKFYLAATQYVLGDWDVPDTPITKK